MPSHDTVEGRAEETTVAVHLVLCTGRHGEGHVREDLRRGEHSTSKMNPTKYSKWSKLDCKWMIQTPGRNLTLLVTIFRLGKSMCPRVLDDQKMAVDNQKLMSGPSHNDQNLSYDYLNF